MNEAAARRRPSMKWHHELMQKPQRRANLAEGQTVTMMELRVTTPFNDAEIRGQSRRNIQEPSDFNE